MYVIKVRLGHVCHKGSGIGHVCHKTSETNVQEIGPLSCIPES